MALDADFQEFLNKKANRTGKLDAGFAYFKANKEHAFDTLESDMQTLSVDFQKTEAGGWNDRNAMHDLQQRTAGVQARLNALKTYYEEYPEVQGSADAAGRITAAQNAYTEAAGQLARALSVNTINADQNALKNSLKAIDEGGYASKKEITNAITRVDNILAQLEEAEKASPNRDLSETKKQYILLRQTLAERNDLYSRYGTQDAFDSAVRESGYYAKYKDMANGRITDALETIAKNEQDARKMGNTLYAERLKEEHEWLQAFANEKAYGTTAEYDAAIERIEKQIEEANKEANKRATAVMPFYAGGMPAPSRYELSKPDKEKLAELNSQKERLQANRRIMEQEEKIKEKYGDIPERADFEELSKYVKARTSEKPYAIETNAYEYINDSDFADKLHEISARQGYDPYGTYRELTDDEKKVFNYLFRKEGYRAAEGYLEDMKIILEKRNEETNREEIKNRLEEHPVLYGIAANIASIPVNVIYGAASGITDAVMGITGKYDPYNPIHGAFQFAQDVRALTSENISSAFGDSVGGQFAAATYQGAMSIGDMAFGALAFGSTPLGKSGVAKHLTGYGISMGVSAASSRAKELYERGASGWQIGVGSIASGVFEMLFEEVSLEQLVKTKTVAKNLPWYKKLWGYTWNTIKQAGVEGSEELATDFANSMADAIMSAVGDATGDGYTTDFEAKINDYMSHVDENGNPYTREEAEKLALRDTALDMWWSFYGGAIAGGVSGAGVTIFRTAMERAELKTFRNKLDTMEPNVLAETVIQKKDVFGAEAAALAEKIKANGYTGDEDIAALKKLVKQEGEQAISDRYRGTEDANITKIVNQRAQENENLGAQVRENADWSVLGEFAKETMPDFDAAKADDETLGKVYTAIRESIEDTITNAGSAEELAERTGGFYDAMNALTKEDSARMEEVYAETLERLESEIEQAAENAMDKPRTTVTREEENMAIYAGKTIAEMDVDAAQARLRTLAQKLGVRVAFDMSNKKGVRGYYLNGVIHVNAAMPQKYASIFAHEFVHHLEQGNQFEAFRAYVEATEVYREYICEMGKSKDFAEAVKNVEKMYRDSYAAAHAAYHDTDIFADFIADVIFGGLSENNAEARARTEALFEQIAAKPKWYQVLRDFLRRMMARLRGDKMQYQLLNTERMLTKAYQEVKTGDKGTQEAVKAGDKKKEPQGIRFSVMNNRAFEENVAKISRMSDEEAKRNKAEDRYIRVMQKTPRVILDNVSDAKDCEIIIRFDALYLAMRESGVLDGNYHALGQGIMNQLPELIADPDAIVRMRDGRLNLLTQIQTERGNTGLISIELNTVKDINSKNTNYNLVVSVFSAKDNYIRNNLRKNGIKVEYEKETLPQVNRQLHESLETVNGKESSDNSISTSAQNVKEKMFEIIQRENPADDEQHTWIRSAEEIKTLEEALTDDEWDYDEFAPDYTRADAEQAVRSGEIEVFSSKPIENGAFVTPSRMEAESYAGNGQVYRQTVSVRDVAWIDPLEGMMAKVDGRKYAVDIKTQESAKNQGAFVDKNAGKRYNKTQGDERNYGSYSEEFRRVQSESRAMPEREKQDFHSGKQIPDEALRRRLSGIFARQLDARRSGGTDGNARITVQAKNGNSFTLISNVDADLFHDIFEISRGYLLFGELVDLHNIETTQDGIGYEDCTNYLSDDGMSGFSITEDGDLISVFNLGNKRGFVDAISTIVKEKAKTLDCYVSPLQNLREIYEKKLAFKTASVMDYNMEFDHDDIAVNHESPRVAFMVNTNEDVETKHFTKDQYDEAVEYRDSYVKKQTDEQEPSGKDARYSFAQNEESAGENQDKKHSVTIHRPDEMTPEKVAAKIKRRYKSQADAKVVAQMFDKALRAAEVSNWDQAIEITRQAGKEIASKIKRERTDYAKDVLAAVRGYRISLTSKQKAEVTYAFGSYDLFRKHHFGTFTLAEDGTPLDIVWQELSDRFPALFDKDTNEGDMPSALAATAESARNMVEQVDVDTVGKMIATELYNAVAEAREAERMEDMALKLKAYKNTNKKLRKQVELTYKSAYMTDQQRKKEFEWEWTERTSRAQMTKEATRNINSLQSKLDTNGNTKHIPEHLKEAVSYFCGAFVRHEDSGQLFVQKGALDQLITAYAALRGTEDVLGTAGYCEEVERYLQAVRGEMGNSNEIALSGLTNHALAAVNDIAQNIAYIVNRENKLFFQGQMVERQELGQRAFNDMRDKPNGKHFVNKFSEKTKEKMMSNLKPCFFFDMMGPTLSDAFKDQLEGQYKTARLAARAKDFADETMKKYHYHSWNKDTQEWNLRDGRTWKLTKDDVLTLYATNRREQIAHGKHMKQGGVTLKNGGKKHGRVDNGLGMLYVPTEGEIEQLTDTLTQEQKDYADAMVGFLTNECAAWGNEVSMKLYGIKRYGGSYYFPYKVDKDYTKNAGQDEGKEKKKALKNQSYTYQTNPDAKNPLIISSFTDVWAEHAISIATYSGMTIPIETMKHVATFHAAPKDGEMAHSFKAEMDRAYGKWACKYLNNYIQDVDGGISYEGGEYKGALAHFKKLSVLGNLSVTVKQFTSLPRAFKVIDRKYFYTSLKHRALTRHLYDECAQWCPVAIIKDAGGFDTSMGNTMKGWILDSGYNKWRESWKENGVLRTTENIFGKLPEFADKVTWATIWAAAKRKAKAETTYSVGSREYYEAAAKYFNDAIEYTQVYDSVLTRSEWMRSKKTMDQMVTSFMAEPTVTVNMGYMAIKEMQQGNYRAAGKTIGAMAEALFFEALAGALVYAARSAPDDDDEEKSTYGDRLLESLTANLIDNIVPLSWIPVAKDFWSASQGFEIKRTDIQPVIDLIECGTKAYQYGAKGEGLKVVEEIAMALGTIFGMPVKNVLRDLKATWNFITDVYTNNVIPHSLNTVKWDAYEGMMDTLPIISILNKGNKKYFQKLYEAQQAGNEEAFQSVYDYLLDKGMDEERIMQGIRARYRESGEVRKSVEEYMALLEEDELYKGLDDKKKEQIQTSLKTYATDRSISQATGKGISNTSSAKAEQAEKQGVSAADYFLAGKLSKDLDGSGGYSKAEKIKAIEEMDLTNNEKQVLISLYTETKK